MHTFPLQQIPHLRLSVAVLFAAVAAAGWGHSMELLGRVHPRLALETHGHYWGIRGHRRVGSQPAVQVSSNILFLSCP